MSNDTDRICRALEAKAIQKFEEQLKLATDNLLRGILISHSTTIEISVNKEIVKIDLDRLLYQVREQITKRAREEICAREVNNFLQNIQHFQQQIQSLEQYGGN